MADAAPEAIERGDDHHVHLAALYDGEEPIEAGSAILGSGDALVDVLRRVPPARSNVLAQVAELRFTGLVVGKGRAPKRITFKLDDEIYRPLAHHCIDADLTIQQFVVDAIRDKLQREAGD